MTSAFQGVMATIERIETERLVGERIEQHHRPLVRRMYQNRTVCATLGGILSDQMIDRTMVSNLDHWDRHGFGIWIFSHKDDDAFVGRAGLRRVEIEGRPEIELAYTVMPEHWNQGYATEMSRRLLSIAFRKLRFPDVACFTLTTNFASQRVMEKLGFVFEREGLHANLDHVFYRLAAQDFIVR